MITRCTVLLLRVNRMTWTVWLISLLNMMMLGSIAVVRSFSITTVKIPSFVVLIRHQPKRRKHHPLAEGMYNSIRKPIIYDCCCAVVRTTTISDTLCKTILFSKDSINDDKLKEQRGYKFGDISRSLANKAKERINNLTGKESYEFGDLSKYLDDRVKTRILTARNNEDNNNNMNNTASYRYQFGDISSYVDNYIKEKASQFAGKQNATEYQLGDITKTIIQKVHSGEYDAGDVFLLLRLLLSAGFVITPIASILPIKALITLVNFGLKEEVSGRVLNIVATELDTRVKTALTVSNSNNFVNNKIAGMILGDITKEKLQDSIQTFTGKKKYEFGDLTDSILNMKKNNIKYNNDNNKQLALLSGSTSNNQFMDQLTLWDENFLKQQMMKK